MGVAEIGQEGESGYK